MNIFDITNEDIARLQENKIVFGLMDERDVKILRKIDIHNTESYCASGFYRCRAGASFNGTIVYRIRPDYTLPTPTEAEIIAYLKASEVAPSKWHPAAQEWARKHDENGVWECKLTTGVWAKTVFIISPVSGAWYSGPHRLRADYGKAKEPIIAQPCYKPSDVSYGPFTLEPEVCVWVSTVEGHPKDPHGKWWCFSKEGIQTEKLHCPVCGKRIEVKP